MLSSVFQWSLVCWGKSCEMPGLHSDGFIKIFSIPRFLTWADGRACFVYRNFDTSLSLFLSLILCTEVQIMNCIQHAYAGESLVADQLVRNVDILS